MINYQTGKLAAERVVDWIDVMARMRLPADPHTLPKICNQYAHGVIKTHEMRQLLVQKALDVNPHHVNFPMCGAIFTDPDENIQLICDRAKGHTEAAETDIPGGHSRGWTPGE